jgi:ribonuclease E
VRLREDQLREDQLREGRLREARLSEERALAGESRPEPMSAEPALTAPVTPVAAAAVSVAAPVFQSPRDVPIPGALRAPEAQVAVRVPVPPPPSPVDIDRALRETGLVMIETSRDKVQPAVPVEEAQAPRARRERRPPPADLDTPLQQVETRKSDSESPPSH